MRACSIVVRDLSQEFFSATGSAEWASLLDDFQLSEEAGPTWECATTGRATRSAGLRHRGVTGAGLADYAAPYEVTGCRAVPLWIGGEVAGVLSLYWGGVTREESLLTTGIAVAAIAAKAIELHAEQEVVHDEAPPEPEPDVARLGATFSDALEARATVRDARAAARDARAAARDARASLRDARAATRPTGAPALDDAAVFESVQARRDRCAAARDRFHARSDRAAARMDREVSTRERVESSIDGLTGAYRRDAGLLELDHEIARARRTGDTFVLAFVDVDRLKVRNDTKGHVAGDQLLRTVADTIRANVRSYDLVVRYGGDEFVCGFPALDASDAAERFARINDDLSVAEEASVAFGLAVLGPDDTLTMLITQADERMYADRYRARVARRAGERIAEDADAAAEVGRQLSTAD